MAEADDRTFLGDDAPPAGAVERAVRGAGGTEGGRVLKAIYLDEQGEPTGEFHSQQMPEDSFVGQKIDGMMSPPLSLEQLVFLAETHPVHSSALEQKVADVVGEGWEWEPIDEDNADEEARDALSSWFDNLAPDDESMEEIINSAWDDAETCGWGFFEVVRDTQGIVRRCYHVPGHTIRAHRDGFRYVQIRNQKRVWFAKWGAEKDGKPIEVDAKTGSMTTVREKASELFLLKRKSRRSTWYGIPGYVSAIGWITLALAARDDNLAFFQNRREPRWVIVLSNLEAGSDVEEDLRRAFVVDMKNPHRNIIIPISGQGKVDFQKLTNDQKDGSFETLSERADKAIMIAHRVPAERLANSQVGPLGGNSTFAASRIYKDAVINPTQSLVNRRLNRFIAVEWTDTPASKARALKTDEGTPVRKAAQTTTEGEPPTWRLKLKDLDISDEQIENDTIIAKFKSNVLTLGEARAAMGLGPYRERYVEKTDVATGEPSQPPEGVEIDGDGYYDSPLNDMLYTQLPGTSNYDDPAASTPGAPSSDDEGDPAIPLIEGDLRKVLREARETNERLAEMAGD